MRLLQAPGSSVLLRQTEQEADRVSGDKKSYAPDPKPTPKKGKR